MKSSSLQSFLLTGLLLGLPVAAGCGGTEVEPKCSDCATADTGGVADMGGEADGGSGEDDMTTGPGCDDGALSGDETDVDCGGSCAPCDVGQECASAEDCASAVCDGTCQEATCEDGVQNRDEAGVDCGGEFCFRCPEGNACANECDCQSGSCVDGTCRPSLVGSWSGSPVGTTGVRITMDFTEERVEWGQSFNNGQMDCFHNGAGAVSNLTDESFDMTGYEKISNSCNLGMFLQEDYFVSYSFTNSERSAVLVEPDGSESYRLRRVVEEEVQCAQPAGPPPIAGEGGFGDLDPYPTYETLFDAFFVEALDPVANSFDVASQADGEPTVYDCPNGGALTVTHDVYSPVEDITYDTVDLLAEGCALSMTLGGSEQALTIDGTLTYQITNRGIGPEHDVEALITSVGDLEFTAECDLYQDQGSCSFADEIGNVIEGAGAARSARSFPRYMP